jgi:hypothetical protein
LGHLSNTLDTTIGRSGTATLTVSSNLNVVGTVSGLKVKALNGFTGVIDDGSTVLYIADGIITNAYVY